MCFWIVIDCNQQDLDTVRGELFQVINTPHATRVAHCTLKWEKIRSARINPEQMDPRERVWGLSGCSLGSLSWQPKHSHESSWARHFPSPDCSTFPPPLPICHWCSPWPLTGSFRFSIFLLVQLQAPPVALPSPLSGWNHITDPPASLLCSSSISPDKASHTFPLLRKVLFQRRPPGIRHLPWGQASILSSSSQLWCLSWANFFFLYPSSFWSSSWLLVTLLLQLTSSRDGFTFSVSTLSPALSKSALLKWQWAQAFQLTGW